MKKDSNKYVSGILGALAGAIIGALPWFVAETFLHYFLSILGAVISLASFYGYKLLGGIRKKGFALTVIIISSILAVIFAEYASQFVTAIMDKEFVEIAAGYGVTATQLATIIVFDPSFIGDIFLNLITGIFFAMLGIFGYLKYIGKYFDEPESVVSEQNEDAEFSAAEESESSDKE